MKAKLNNTIARYERMMEEEIARQNRAKIHSDVDLYRAIIVALKSLKG